MNPRSMTGYARVRKLADDREFIITVKGVNHRGLDIHFRMAPELDAFEHALRAAVKRHVARGHVQVQVRVVDSREAAPSVVNQSLIEAYITAFRRMAAVHGLSGDPDLNAALRIPGAFESREEEPDPDLERQLVEALEEALVIFNQFREREGAEIAADIKARNTTVLRNAREMAEIRARAVPEFQARLSERLGELLNSTSIDPQRLAQEVAYLVDRSDISEELTRLKVHAVQLNDLLEGGGEVGKKLDFLLQEMHRETNTILSKSAGIGEVGLEIGELALNVKAEIEKIREQGLNLE
ncbi:MAG TPA: YicC family protein [Bryobacteraceae bacterium]|nr:YicC family protein [Bryobacteraceae bacterium]HOQ45026.1 YicC family protein [Bryobacteraceae bacterium]HPQ16045.1 YicC family protein [Bryobacteraceae bacterium]HPU73730.1 YicC family protein [Bryobacteraceae bacterium]